MDLFEDLQWRGLVHQCAFSAKAASHEPAVQETMFTEALSQHEDQPARWLNGKQRTLYCGFDPTSDSLHVGSLLPAMLLRRFQRAGHRPIALVGGATGMVGDPTGKSEERNLLSTEQLERNVAGIERQLRALLDFDGANG